MSVLSAVSISEIKARGSIKDADVLKLRRSYYDDGHITAEEAGLLRQALADYCQAEGAAAHRRTALATLAKEGRPELQAQLEKELHLALQAHRVLSGDLFQLLLALEDVGERRRLGDDVRAQRLLAVEPDDLGRRVQGPQFAAGLVAVVQEG